VASQKPRVIVLSGDNAPVQEDQFLASLLDGVLGNEISERQFKQLLSA
jgi:hypothetical protein